MRCRLLILLLLDLMLLPAAAAAAGGTSSSRRAAWAWWARAARPTRGSPTSAAAAAGEGGGGGDGGSDSSADPSPIEPLSIWGRRRGLFVKRDDQLDLLRAGVHGNKARKLFTLAEWGLAGRLPPVIASHGGVQSNALAALAGLVGPAGGRFPAERFVYFCKPLPKWLRARPLGTFARALSLGVEFNELSPRAYHSIFGGGADDGNEGEEVELASPDEVLGRLRAAGLVPAAAAEAEKGQQALLFIPQGGAFPGAARGVRALGREIEAWWAAERRKEDERGGVGGPPSRPRPPPSLAVVLPAGTGTTALGLARALMAPSSGGNDITVYAVPCVGGGTYLGRQMRRLARSLEMEGGEGEEGVCPPPVLPVVLEGAAPHAFARPEKELLDIWRALRREGRLTLDLIYGPQAWRVLRERCWPAASSSTTTTTTDGDDDPGVWTLDGGREHTAVLYVHTGGLEGLASQLGRYRRLGLLSDEQEAAEFSL